MKWVLILIMKTGGMGTSPLKIEQIKFETKELCQEAAYRVGTATKDRFSGSVICAQVSK